MKTTTTFMILIVSETREAPSSTFPAADVVDTSGVDAAEQQLRPLAKCLPSRELKKAGAR